MQADKQLVKADYMIRTLNRQLVDVLSGEYVIGRCFLKGQLLRFDDNDDYCLFVPFKLKHMLNRIVDFADQTIK